ncbi:MAG: OmpH family outer membrane protein [Alcaligenaceae bacterium]|nr:OmpH family outer membrane protein [Alcaligenaceae bacterium]
MKSQIALKVSALSQGLGRSQRAWMLASMIAVGAALAVPAAPVQAQGTKIGFVSTDRILRDSPAAKAAQTKIEREFRKREDELQKLADSLNSDIQKFDKDAPVLSESERVTRQRRLADKDTDLQRKRREFQEDLNRRRSEEFSTLIEQADAAIKAIAEREGYDLIIQDAVTVSPRVDITDQVLKALGG